MCNFFDITINQDVNSSFRLGGVAVEKIKETKKKIMSAVEKARLFKEQRMYGGKIPRMTSKL